MVHCRRCGQRIAEDAIACPHCGAAQGLAGPAVDEVPRGVRGWSWGAFLLNWFWGPFNGTWIALLCLVPGIGFVMAVILGFKGREWAWKNRRWDSVDHFNRVQRRWSIGGLVVWLLPILFVAVASLFWSDELQRAPPGATRVSIDPPAWPRGPASSASRTDQRPADPGVG